MRNFLYFFIPLGTFGIIGAVIVATFCTPESKELYFTEFIIFEASNYDRITEADYSIMSKADTEPVDGTQRSKYFFVGDTLIKAGHTEYETLKACADKPTKNKFALIKKEHDRYYTLVRLTYNEPNTVIIADK